MVRVVKLVARLNVPTGIGIQDNAESHLSARTAVSRFLSQRLAAPYASRVCSHTENGIALGSLSLDSILERVGY